ncbi:MAG TPA: multiheme c-type cytochrome [Blastocatellia bacterium]|nr:multiheme c-type cytochrome [Blastocatellia bacterium]
MRKTKRVLLLVALGCAAALCVYGPAASRGQTQAQADTPLAKLSQWQARDYPGNRYVGSNACGPCHSGKLATQSRTPMAHALEPADDVKVLRLNPRLTFRGGAYRYQIVYEKGRATYTVTDGKTQISEPVLYSFGMGSLGQTYLFRHDGALYESRVTYYVSLGGLDLTGGQEHLVSTTVEEALGRRLNSEDARGCFACHAPSAVEGAELRLDHFTPGVTCESCHGPGEKHVAAMKAGQYDDRQIFNPGTLDGISLSQEFCGTCHRGFGQVLAMPAQGGANNIRFQPYRIFNSRGHNRRDLRISCVACHDPHQEIRRDAAFYDAKCLACHLGDAKEAKTAERMAAACPVGRRQCADCHMPKIEQPEMHSRFADHWIRVVKPGAPVPK